MDYTTQADWTTQHSLAGPHTNVVFVTVFAISQPKQSLDRPVGLQQGEAHRISRPSAYEGGKLSDLRTGRLYPQEITPLVLISVRN